MYCLFALQFFVFLAFIIQKGGSMMLRNHFLFEKEKSKFMDFMILVIDIVSITIFSKFYLPTDSITFTHETIKKSLFNNVMTIFMYIASEIYFDTLRQEVFNNVKTYSEKVEQSTKDKEMFFASMSHEIRNPLQSLLGSAELLQTCADDAQKMRYLKILKNGGEIILNLISNILDVSKIAAQKMELAITASSLNESIDRIVRMLIERAKGKNLTIEYTESGKIPAVLSFDPGRLQQVAINIISNAIKFTQKGKIIVRTEWIPLPHNSLNIKQEIEKELNSSNWKCYLSSTQEIYDETLEKAKRAKISKTFVRPHYFNRCLMTVKSESMRHDEILLYDQSAKSAIPEEYVRRTVSRKPSDSNYCPPSPIQEKVKGIIKIEVMDTGIGIKKQDAEHLFEPYKQANATICQYFYKKRSLILKKKLWWNWLRIMDFKVNNTASGR